MKFFKASLAALAAVALLSQPALAQEAETEKKAGVFDVMKALVTGGGPTGPFIADPEGHILNITDANYKETIFDDEWIIAFCSAESVPCADYFPTYLDAAVTMKGETNTKFSAVWVEESPRLAARFFVPSRLPFLVYAKDGDFRQIPYVRNDTQFLINFIEEETYKNYGLLDGPLGPYSTFSLAFERYAEGAEWVGQYTAWMPKWMLLMIAGSMSGVVFSLFSGGSNYSSDPSKYPHLNADGTLKKKVIEPASEDAAITEGNSTSAKVTKTKTTSTSTKKKSKKA